jgi:hypothetical protein
MKEHRLWPTRLAVMDNLWVKFADGAAEDTVMAAAKALGIDEKLEGLDSKLSAAAINSYDRHFNDPEVAAEFKQGGAYDRNNEFFQLQQEAEINYHVEPYEVTGDAAVDAKAQAAKEAQADGRLHQQWQHSELWRETPEVKLLAKAAYKLCKDFVLKQAGRSMLSNETLERNTEKELADQATLFIWAAVYEEGSYHSSHTHENSLCSGVYYSRGADGSADDNSGSLAPLVFSDPRGSSATAAAVANRVPLDDPDSTGKWIHAFVVLPAPLPISPPLT